MDFFRKVSASHSRLKERIHSFRIPLSPTGQRFMGVVYFFIPVIAGYFLMQMVINGVPPPPQQLSTSSSPSLLLQQEGSDAQKKQLKQLLDKHQKRI